MSRKSKNPNVHFVPRITNLGSGSHFSAAVNGAPVHSSMVADPVRYNTFNASEIVPIYCAEVLPDDVFEIRLREGIIRQTTMLTPTMGNLVVDYYSFFVPNRVVNESWKAVMGENINGSWTAPDVVLAPLVNNAYQANGVPAISNVSVPVGSVADHYGFPTQLPIPYAVLNACNDLKFRGYVSIYNEYFRDQNYQPPIPFSTLNVYQGFFDHHYTSPARSLLLPRGSVQSGVITAETLPNHSSGTGDFGVESYAATMGVTEQSTTSIGGSVPSVPLADRFDALGSPLRANKLHDYFTSVLPSQCKGPVSMIPLSGGGLCRVYPRSEFSDPPAVANYPNITYEQGVRYLPGGVGFGTIMKPFVGAPPATSDGTSTALYGSSPLSAPSGAQNYYSPFNLGVDISNSSLSLSLDDLRMSAAVQQLYEVLARGGSRYRERIRSLYGLEVDDPFLDIPMRLGHVRRTLDIYQTAQTSPSAEDSTPQGNLAAFGYTNTSGVLVPRTRFYEDGYIHIFAVVRHRNIYSSYLSRDNFRRSMIDWYSPTLANISEQPIYTREINPFVSDPGQGFAFQEAWAEYRFEPDTVSGYMRPGVQGSLALWNYADPFDSGLTIANASFLRSNTKEVVDRTLAVQSSLAPQFKGQFHFDVYKDRPLPTYSVPGLDVI
ncbi:MAG: major capsid protein [Microviridae sp.]|nr:MAG: major capsid protein [Microviridae sp.]